MLLHVSSPFLQLQQSCKVQLLSLCYVEAPPLIRLAFKHFQSWWTATPHKLFNGQTCQPIQDPHVQLAARQLLTQEPLLQALFQTESHAELHSSLAAGFFAAATGSEHVYTEKDFLPSLRLCITGSRVVIMMPVQSVWDWAMPGTDVNSSKIASMILALSTEQVAQMSRMFPVFSATLGPGDLLYTPPGWIMAERIATYSGQNAQADARSSVG